MPTNFDYQKNAVARAFAVSKMGELEKMLVSTVMLELGIVPLDNTKIDITEALSRSSPDDIRTMKRKFRKVWRKAAKKLGCYNTQEVGVKDSHPTKGQKARRKQMVLGEVLHENVKPIIALYGK